MEDTCSICGSEKFTCPDCKKECYFCHVDIKMLYNIIYAVCLFCEAKVKIGVKEVGIRDI